MDPKTVKSVAKSSLKPIPFTHQKTRLSTRTTDSVVWEEKAR